VRDVVCAGGCRVRRRCCEANAGAIVVGKLGESGESMAGSSALATGCCAHDAGVHYQGALWVSFARRFCAPPACRLERSVQRLKRGPYGLYASISSL